MNIAYGTYGMPNTPLDEAAPRLAALGYGGVEICVAERYPTAPARLDAAARAGLRDLLAARRLPPNALMMLASVMGDEDEHQASLRALAEACTLAHDLGLPSPAVITTTLGGKPEPWEEPSALLVARLKEWAALAAREGCVIAAEPHVGGLVDRPERAEWLVEAVGSPALRLNFDISHFAIQGMPTEQTVARLAPLAVHAHVKDGRMVDGRVQFLLPGEGNFDYAAYLKAMRAAGYEGDITVEISGMVSGRPDYEPYEAARKSLRALEQAFATSRIERRSPAAD